MVSKLPNMPRRTAVLTLAVFPLSLALSLGAAPTKRDTTELGRGQNPIIQTKFTADPAPFVYKGTVYLFTSHDEEDAEGFLMRDWLLYTSTDMVNWTDRGTVASLRNFKWADPKLTGWGGFDNGAWAPQVVTRNGKFYMYCPVQGRGIGVLVSDNLMGPYTDSLGKPLIGAQFDSIDPTILFHKGQAYLYWGNPNLWYARLNKDMISLDGEPIKDPSVAKVPNQSDPYHYQEGPWAYQRKNKFYMAFAGTCCPEGIAYAMSDTPIGPWVPKGYAMLPDGRSSGNHPGILDYKGKTYLFGFNYTLNRAISTRHRERRSVCVAEMTFNPDGSIAQVPWWDEAPGVRQLAPLNPYRRNEAETMSWSSGSRDSQKWTQGVRSEPCASGGMDLGQLPNRSYTKVSGVDFDRGARELSLRVASGGPGGQVEVRIDGLNGPKIATVPVLPTGGWQNWTTVNRQVQAVAGVHDLYFIFLGGNEGPLLSFDSWQFSK